LVRRSGSIVLHLGLLLTGPTPPATAACHGGAANGIRDPGEQCDGADTGPYLCQHFCFTGGSVRCASNCTIDTSLCEGCGNGRREYPEQCDGSDLGGATCDQPGETGGTPSCAPNCTLDHSTCWRCGNGRIDPGEQCDGNQLGGATCNAPGETGGVLTCAGSCTLDRTGCWRCGNGRIDPGELCDDGNGQAGDGCGPDCRLECGNGSVQPNEECDDGNTLSGDGCHFCGLEEVYDGGGNDTRECAVHWGVSGPPPPAGTVTCGDGDGACDQDGVPGQCTFRVFYCFNRAEFGQGPPPCSPTNIATVALTGPSLSGPQALTAAAQDAVLNAMTATLTMGGSSVSRAGVQLTANPPMLTPRTCGLFALTVPVGPGRAVSVRATDSVGSTDNDILTFQCS
jgi:cysteine-rich repeat protein